MSVLLYNLLPWIFLGMTLKIAAPHMKQTNKTFLSTGLGCGVGLGFLLPSVIESLPIAHSITGCMLLGVIVGTSIKKKW